MKTICFFLLLIILASCGNESETPVNVTLSVKQGETVTLKLNANHSTSYKWYLTNKPDIVDSVDYNYEVQGSDDGAGGMEYWKFKGIKKGKDSLRFVYRGHNGTQAGARSYLVEVE